MWKGYYEDLMIDIRQRMAVLEVIFDNCANSLKDVSALRSDLRRGLAEHAVNAAKQPFMRGDAAKVSEFLAVAIQLDPNMDKALAWKSHSARSVVGPRLFAAR